MEINNIIGNPPYQYKNQSIYQYFIDRAIEFKPKQMVYIVKNNWMMLDTLKNTRDNMIDYGIDKIINFVNTYEIFPEAHVKVNIFKLVKDKQSDITLYKEVDNNTTITEKELRLEKGKRIIIDKIQEVIINKIKNESTYTSYSLCKNARVFSIASNGNYMLANETVDILKYITNPEEYSKDEVITVKFIDEYKRIYNKYILLEDLPKGREYVHLYKLICGSKVGDNKKQLTSLKILEPNEIMTNSFSLVGMLRTRYETESLLKYTQTKIFKFLIKIRLTGVRVTLGPGLMQDIPMQDFTEISDINWDGTIDEIDKQLYNKYNLNKEEIEYIESFI